MVLGWKNCLINFIYFLKFNNNITFNHTDFETASKNKKSATFLFKSWKSCAFDFPSYFVPNKYSSLIYKYPYILKIK